MHGMDVRMVAFRGFCDAEMVMRKGDDASPVSSSSQETDGTSTPCETKKHIQEEDIAQIIKICVVSSFTENNLHPRLNPLVPIIAIDPENARICLYDAQKDVLLLSEEFKCIDHDKDVFNYVGATLLWAMINHRYVTNNVRIKNLLLLNNFVVDIG